MTSSWQEVSFLLEGDQVELASEILSALDALSVTTQAVGDQPDWLDLAEPIRPAWQHVKVTGLFDPDTDLVHVVSQLVHEGIVRSPTHVDMSVLADRVWEREWMDQFGPFEVAQDLWVVPTHSNIPAQARRVIHLDPGLAFGTGTHPTTALCLSAIAEMDLSGKNVLDYGCGSGILAIAALICGATEGVGVDIDRRALSATLENAALNSVSNRIRTCHPEDLANNYCAKLVIANILADTLVELSTVLERHVAPDGRLVLSGVLTHQIEQIVGHFGSAWRFEQVIRETWVMLIGTRAT